MNYEQALAWVRFLVEAGVSRGEAVKNPAVPEAYQTRIEAKLQEEEQVIVLSPVEITEAGRSTEWLDKRDRSHWYYWPRLRDYLIRRGWPLDRVRGLDDSSDTVLKNLSPPEPETDGFDDRGLVLGYVQSGKTANYTALIAKAVDVGFRLVVVLAGMDNGLRRQTQVRLQKELTGSKNLKDAIALPEMGRRWHTFTTEDINGDFRAENVNTASLQGSQPVLLVVKKNGHVLNRILRWLDNADVATFRCLPALVIDDEADQASINVARFDEDSPSAINRKIRELLNKFSRCAYVAYTATPFANILIPVNAQVQGIGDDLYPKNFIIALPRPKGYMGAEALFGQRAFAGGEDVDDGLNVIRIVPKQDVDDLGESHMPQTLRDALMDFVLADAARAQRLDRRGHADGPATMLIHTSRSIGAHDNVSRVVRDAIDEIRDQWRYNKNNSGIKTELLSRWKREFMSLEKTAANSVEFSDLEEYIRLFLESVSVMVINSDQGDVADYEKNPSLKVIAIGGNKLSRGLTLEGLLVSYFTRSTNMYDTLMQMGRWFGYREGYVDLTRLYTTADMADRFHHLALVEHQIREDLTVYKSRNLTPRECGMRILAHPSMLVTSQLKQANAERYVFSFAEILFQTFRFPLDNLSNLAAAADTNLQTVKNFLSGLGTHKEVEKRPMWRDVAAEKIREFLGMYQNEEHANELRAICEYVRRRNEGGELRKWTVAIRHLNSPKKELGVVDWGIGVDLNQMSRTRLIKATNSLGVITDPGDEKIGLSPDVLRAEAEALGERENKAARTARSPDEGLLLLYPISKNSSPTQGRRGSRARLFDEGDSLARDLIGVAISFPKSKKERPEEYIHNATLAHSVGRDDE